MVNWKEKTLGEVTSFITKGIPPKYSDYESESTIWVLNQKCNRNFEISYADARLHDYNFKKVPENKMLMNGDVLINSTGTGTAGRVAQLQNIKKLTTIDGHMILLRPTDDIDSLYYGYAIKSCQSQIEGLAEGSTGQTELNLKRLQDEIIIRYPVDKQEQKAIAYFLSDLDEKIKINVKINNNLEQQAQSIFKYWFVDFEPFGKKMPTDWCNGTIDDLAKDIVCGKTPSTRKADYYGTDIPFITIPDMHDKIYSITTERHLSVLGANSQAKKNLPKNSICVSCIGTAGLVTLVAEESQTNQQINSIIPKDEFSPYFIYLLMQTLSDTINKLGQGGSTIVNLNKSQFAKIQVTIPAIPAMTDFDKIVSPIFEKILQNQKENLCLTSLRDNLLSKLMSGELDVSNINF